VVQRTLFHVSRDVVQDLWPSQLFVLQTGMAPISHHIITIGEAFPWASILSLELKNAIQSSKKRLQKKPNFYLTALIVDISVLIFVTLIWDGVGNCRPPVQIYHFEL